MMRFIANLVCLAIFSSACAKSYVDKVNEKDLIEAAINGMLTSLDPHSSFLNNDNYSDMQVQTKGKFGDLVSKSPWKMA